MQGVDVISIDCQYLRIVVNRIMVLAKFCETICSIVQSFDVVYSAIFHLVGVVFYRVLEALHFSVDQSTVRVDYRIRCIKLDCLVKVVN